MVKLLGDPCGDPVEVQVSRRRAVIRLMARIQWRQRQRELMELGFVDLGGEG